MAKINIKIVQKLISDQFPEYKNLQIVEFAHSGHDNHTYVLGEDMLIRLPKNKYYEAAVEIEQKWLPYLQKYLAIDIPVPIKIGAATNEFQHKWSIYKWIDGSSLNLIRLNNSELKQLALDLAKFLKTLQLIPIPRDAPKPSADNWYRGAHVSVYENQFFNQITKLAFSNVLSNDICERAINLWTAATKTKLVEKAVWIHGDFAAGNILHKNGKLSAVIDFGCVATGDPACDYVIAWTFLTPESRKIFMNESNLDKDTWLRAKAWGLWKATFLMLEENDSFLQHQIIRNILFF